MNGPEFIIRKGDLFAVFDMDGKQLTEFVVGTFRWKWAPCNCHGEDLRIIYNKEAGIELEPR